MSLTSSGARMATMIGVIGTGTAQCGRGIGDVITANVKEASADAGP